MTQEVPGIKMIPHSEDSLTAGDAKVSILASSIEKEEVAKIEALSHALRAVNSNLVIYSARAQSRRESVFKKFIRTTFTNLISFS